MSKLKERPYKALETTRQRFTRGDCAKLARELYKRLKDKGWKLVLVSDCEGDCCGEYDYELNAWVKDETAIPCGQPGSDSWPCFFGHAAVLSPCGKYALDIEGINNVEDFLARWSSSFLHDPGSLEQYDIMTEDWHYDYSTWDEPDRKPRDAAYRIVKAIEEML